MTNKETYTLHISEFEKYLKGLKNPIISWDLNSAVEFLDDIFSYWTIDGMLIPYATNPLELVEKTEEMRNGFYHFIMSWKSFNVKQCEIIENMIQARLYEALVTVINNCSNKSSDSISGVSWNTKLGIKSVLSDEERMALLWWTNTN